MLNLAEAVAPTTPQLSLQLHPHLSDDTFLVLSLHRPLPPVTDVPRLAQLHHLPSMLKTECFNWTGGDRDADIEHRLRKVWYDDLQKGGAKSKLLMFCNKSTRVSPRQGHRERRADEGGSTARTITWTGSSVSVSPSPRLTLILEKDPEGEGVVDGWSPRAMMEDFKINIQGRT